MANVPQIIYDLVERFKNNIDEYRSPKYNETLTRVEFINPFWKALGWDVNNEAGYAMVYRDVIHEDEIKVGGATKAPDYSFRIGGTRKFFLETKKPSVNLKNDPSSAFQLRRYAYSANLPLSILTDFEEFIVYDCRKKTLKSDNASVARIKYYTFQDYIEKWEEIEGIFSKEAIMKGSFDKFARSTIGKKGTAEIDKDFLGDLDKWRLLLARNISLRNPKLDVRELNYAVQMTIDRLIFLRMCEDRGIERYGQLQALRNGQRIYSRLVEIYRKADHRYNSGLFHFRIERDNPAPPDTCTLELSIDDKVLKDIIKDLYYPDCPYEFSVLPPEILGNAYEQFLGKVIRLTTGHQAKIEEKPEVRKAGGVYYTPKYIVDYIVQNTIGKLCESKNPRTISKVRILDPACGSGSFLLGAYQYLLDWHLKYYLKEIEKTGKIPTALPPEGKRRKKSDPNVIFQGRGGEWMLTTTEKKHILLNNIYGVDIDPQAVEVTKLSLLLKVLENENQDTLKRQLTLWGERALPDLANNIKCGNSLIGPDFKDSQQRSLFELDIEVQYRINAFDWKHPTRGFGWIFKENDRFDAVIGNPPYIRIQRIDHDEADYFFNKYKTPASKTDLSQLFLEKALELVAENGWIGFICTSQWMATEYGRKMRKYLSTGFLHNIIDFGSLPVFKSADTYPAIFILSRRKTKELNLVSISNVTEFSLNGINSASAKIVPITLLSEDPWNLSGFDIYELLKRKQQRWVALKEYGHAYIGTLTGMDEAFVVTKEAVTGKKLEEQILFPYAYRGAEVSRYSIVEPAARIIYPYKSGKDGSPILISEEELRSNYPNIFRHLSEYKVQLRKRKDSRKFYATGHDWYRHLRAGSFNYIRPRKLLVKGIDTRTCIGILNENTVFNGANCPGIILKESYYHLNEYIMGILNSALISYWLRTICPAKLGGYTRFTATNLTKTPIPVIDPKNKVDKENLDRMISLVKTILRLQKELQDTTNAIQIQQLEMDIDVVDNEIDNLVFDLYGLSNEEIRIVKAEING